MRILIVSEVFWPEDFMVNEMAKEWVQMGHHVEVISQYPSYPQSYVYDNYINHGECVEQWQFSPDYEPITIHRFEFIEGYKSSKKAKFSNYLKFIRDGKKIARRIGKDFDVAFVSQTGPLTVALPALAAKKKWNVPVAILTLDIWPDVVWMYGVPEIGAVKYFLNKLIKHIYSHCDKIFISSKRFASTINQYVDKECVYAPNWLRKVEEKQSSLRLEHSTDTDEKLFHFTFTGNISRYQNLTNTIVGFQKAGLKNCVFNIVGNGSYLDNLKSFVEHNKIKNVEFRGRFPYNEMGDIMKQSDVLILPLIDNEGIMKTEPLKLQSYLDAGKPIFGILGGGGKDIIDEYDLGICANPSDTDDIARKFQEIFKKSQSSSYVQGIAEREKKVIETRFNKDRILKTLTEGLVDITSSAHDPR